jgi:YggT family protein
MIGYFLEAFARILNFALSCFLWIVIAKAILSWVSPDPFNPIVRFVNGVTEPVLYRIRSWIPLNFSGFDLSPIIVFLIIIFLQSFVVKSIARLSLYFM